MNPNYPNHPRVSIILRTRNRPDLLARAIADVRAQSFSGTELVVVDDYDDPRVAADVVAAADSQEGEEIVLVSRAHFPHGRWLAANAGLDVARGEYIVLHDDDDLWEPEFLTRTTAHLDAHRDSVAVCVRTDIVIERVGDHDALVQTDRYAFLPELHCVRLVDMVQANRIAPISLLYRAALHHELGQYDPALPVLGDWEFYLRVIARHRIDFIDETLALWSHRPEAEGDATNSISASLVRQATESRIRDSVMRRSTEGSDLPVFMHVAYEAEKLGSRIESLVDARSESVDERLTDLFAVAGHERRTAEAALARKVDAIADSLQQLHAAVGEARKELRERTSVTHRLRGFILRRRK